MMQLEEASGDLENNGFASFSQQDMGKAPCTWKYTSL